MERSDDAHELRPGTAGEMLEELRENPADRIDREDEGRTPGKPVHRRLETPPRAAPARQHRDDGNHDAERENIARRSEQA